MIKRFYSPGTGGFYSDEPHAALRPDDCIEVSESKYNALMAAQEKGKEIVFTASGLVARAPIVTMETIRAARNRKLRNTDWTQTLDIPEATRTAYAEYRAALRALPQTFPDPTAVVLPTPPNSNL
jgi:hypothetical protein